MYGPQAAPNGFQRVTQISNNPFARGPTPGVASTTSQNTSQNVVCTTLNNVVGKRTQLQLASTRAVGKSGLASITLLMDTASNRSYIREDLAKELKLESTGKEFLAYSTFGGESSTKPVERNLYEVEVLDKEGKTIILPVVAVPTLCAPLFVGTLPAEYIKHFNHLELSYPMTHTSHLVKIHILIGIDNYYRIATDEPPVRYENLVALPSRLGHILSGVY